MNIKQLADELRVDILELRVACSDLLKMVDPTKDTELKDWEIADLRSHFSHSEPPKKQLQQASPASPTTQRPTPKPNLATRQNRQEELTNHLQNQQQQHQNIVAGRAAQKTETLRQLALHEAKEGQNLAKTVAPIKYAAFTAQMAQEDANFFGSYRDMDSHLSAIGTQEVDVGSILEEVGIRSTQESYQSVKPLENWDFSSLNPMSCWNFENDSEES